MKDDKNKKVNTNLDDQDTLDMKDTINDNSVNDINENVSQKKTDNSQEILEANNKYLRAIADYQNLERQTQIWKEEFVKYASLNLVIKLLEVVDDLEKAQEHINDQGLAIIINKLKSILRDNGVEEVQVLGKKFDPMMAEAVGMNEGNDQEVIEVVQKGYKLADRVIRVAKVIVGTGVKN